MHSTHAFAWQASVGADANSFTLRETDGSVRTEAGFEYNEDAVCGLKMLEVDDSAGSKGYIP